MIDVLDIELWDYRFIRLAEEISTWSKDPSKQIGCIAVKDRRVIATGYNGFPMGIEDVGLDDRDNKYKKMVHAEQNMIYNACRHGVSLIGATVYVTGLPVCGECCKGLVQTGIKEVFMPCIEIQPDRWIDSCTLGENGLTEAGVSVKMYNPNHLWKLRWKYKI